MFLLKFFIWVGLGGMAAGVYHQNIPLTLATGFVFTAGVRILTSASAPIIVLEPNNKKETKDTNNE